MKRNGGLMHKNSTRQSSGCARHTKPHRPPAVGPSRHGQMPTSKTRYPGAHDSHSLERLTCQSQQHGHGLSQGYDRYTRRGDDVWSASTQSRPSSSGLDTWVILPLLQSPMQHRAGHRRRLSPCTDQHFHPEQPGDGPCAPVYTDRHVRCPPSGLPSSSPGHQNSKVTSRPPSPPYLKNSGDMFPQSTYVILPGRRGCRLPHPQPAARTTRTMSRDSRAEMDTEIRHDDCVFGHQANDSDSVLPPCSSITEISSDADPVLTLPPSPSIPFSNRRFNTDSMFFNSRSEEAKMSWQSCSSVRFQESDSLGSHYISAYKPPMNSRTTACRHGIPQPSRVISFASGSDAASRARLVHSALESPAPSGYPLETDSSAVTASRHADSNGLSSNLASVNYVCDSQRGLADSQATAGGGSVIQSTSRSGVVTDGLCRTCPESYSPSLREAPFSRSSSASEVDSCAGVLCQTSSTDPPPNQPAVRPNMTPSYPISESFVPTCQSPPGQPSVEHFHTTPTSSQRSSATYSERQYDSSDTVVSKRTDVESTSSPTTTTAQPPVLWRDSTTDYAFSKTTDAVPDSNTGDDVTFYMYTDSVLSQKRKGTTTTFSSSAYSVSNELSVQTTNSTHDSGSGYLSATAADTVSGSPTWEPDTSRYQAVPRSMSSLVPVTTEDTKDDSLSSNTGDDSSRHGVSESKPILQDLISMSNRASRDLLWRCVHAIAALTSDDTSSSSVSSERSSNSFRQSLLSSISSILNSLLAKHRENCRGVGSSTSLLTDEHSGNEGLLSQPQEDSESVSSEGSSHSECDSDSKSGSSSNSSASNSGSSSNSSASNSGSSSNISASNSDSKSGSSINISGSSINSSVSSASNSSSSINSSGSSASNSGSKSGSGSCCSSSSSGSSSNSSGSNVSQSLRTGSVGTSNTFSPTEHSASTAQSSNTSSTTSESTNITSSAAISSASSRAPGTTRYPSRPPPVEDSVYTEQPTSILQYSPCLSGPPAVVFRSSCHLEPDVLSVTHHTITPSRHPKRSRLVRCDHDTHCPDSWTSAGDTSTADDLDVLREGQGNRACSPCPRSPVCRPDTELNRRQPQPYALTPSAQPYALKPSTQPHAAKPRAQPYTTMPTGAQQAPLTRPPLPRLVPRAAHQPVSQCPAVIILQQPSTFSAEDDDVEPISIQVASNSNAGGCFGTKIGCCCALTADM